MHIILNIQRKNSDLIGIYIDMEYTLSQKKRERKNKRVPWLFDATNDIFAENACYFRNSLSLNKNGKEVN